YVLLTVVFVLSDWLVPDRPAAERRPSGGSFPRDLRLKLHELGAEVFSVEKRPGPADLSDIDSAFQPPTRWPRWQQLVLATGGSVILVLLILWAVVVIPPHLIDTDG